MPWLPLHKLKIRKSNGLMNNQPFFGGHMNTITKNIAIFLVSLNLVACSSTTLQDNSFSKTENKKFTKYTNELVVEMAESSYTTMHQYFENPENYGIDVKNVKVSLGDFYTNETENLKEDIKDLEQFNRATLTKTQQSIYDELEYENALNLKLENKKYKYLTNCWSSMSGIHQNLIQTFSDFIIRDENDILDLVTLIQDVPRYTDEVLKYTKAQAKKGLLSFNYDSVIEDIQTTIQNKDSSSVTNALYASIDALNLESDKTSAYKATVKQAMDESFFPSYQTMLDTLQTLQSKVQPLSGLANSKSGKKYYKLLVQSYTGCSDSISKMKENINNEIDDILSDFQTLYFTHPDAVDEIENLTTDYTDINQILVDLQNNYSSIFPKVDTMEYDLQALPDDRCVSGVVAYFNLPALDFSQKYQIRYNQRDYGSDPSSISLYQTLAHEGIAGHMYQSQYNKEHFKYPIQYFLGYLGFTEGWATYVEQQSLQFLNVKKNVIAAYQLNSEISNMYTLLMDISIHYDGLSLNEFKNTYGDMFESDSLESIYNQLADNPGVFMSYYYGYLQIVNLKEKAKNELKDDFDIVKFNNALLKYGSLNFDIITNNVNQYISANK